MIVYVLYTHVNFRSVHQGLISRITLNFFRVKQGIPREKFCNGIVYISIPFE